MAKKPTKGGQLRAVPPKRKSILGGELREPTFADRERIARQERARVMDEAVTLAINDETFRTALMRKLRGLGEGRRGRAGRDITDRDLQMYAVMSLWRTRFVSIMNG